MDVFWSTAGNTRLLSHDVVSWWTATSFYLAVLWSFIQGSEMQGPFVIYLHVDKNVQDV